MNIVHEGFNLFSVHAVTNEVDVRRLNKHLMIRKEEIILSIVSSFKLPCGSKNKYPEKLDYLTRKGGICVFHTSSDKDLVTYLVATNKKGMNFITQGSAFEIAFLYEELDLPELEVNDKYGLFSYKFAENEELFKSALNKSDQKS